MAQAQYRHEKVGVPPRGWRVRTVTRKQHQVRIAFPPGPRRKGAGRVVEILHPRAENAACNRRKFNPVLESILGGLAAGTAVVASQAYLKSRQEKAANPPQCGQAWKKPGRNITDRAHRYRAQQCAPSGRRQCELCSSKRFLVVDHRDGNETNDSPSNLRWLCKSCNTRRGKAMARSGRGRRTRQFNAGAQTLGQYVQAVIEHRRGAHDAGGRIIHETPKARRQEYAAQIWRIRKQRGNPQEKPIGPLTGQEVAWLIRVPGLRIGKKELKRMSGEDLQEIKRSLQRIDELNRQSRENPNGKGAAAIYESFHGRSPTEVLELQEACCAAGDYAALGEMRGLWLELPARKGQWGAPDIEFTDADGVKLAAAAPLEGSTQLYLIGGNQRLPLNYLGSRGADIGKEFIPLGTVYGISYLTEKSFDGFRSSEYVHEFGEETGERPTAFYNKGTKRIVLVGGAYSIAPTDKRLGASPGIVN